MKSANPSLKKYDIRNYPISLLDQISPSDIEEYLFYLKYYEKDGVVHTNDERGIKRKLASLRTFYNFYFRKEFIDTNPASKVTLPKIHEKNIIRLDTDEVAQLNALFLSLQRKRISVRSVENLVKSIRDS